MTNHATSAQVKHCQRNHASFFVRSGCPRKTATLATKCTPCLFLQQQQQQKRFTRCKNEPIVVTMFLKPYPDACFVLKCVTYPTAVYPVVYSPAPIISTSSLLAAIFRNRFRQNDICPERIGVNQSWPVLMTVTPIWLATAPNRKGIQKIEGFDWSVNVILICDWPHLLTSGELWLVNNF